MKKLSFLHHSNTPFTVIPTCVDLNLFKPKLYSKINKTSNKIVLGYVGSIGGYYLFNEVLKCINKLIEMNIDFHLLIINRGEHTLVKQQMSEAGIQNSKFKFQVSSCSVTH